MDLSYWQRGFFDHQFGLVVQTLDDVNRTVRQGSRGQEGDVNGAGVRREELEDQAP